MYESKISSHRSNRLYDFLRNIDQLPVLSEEKKLSCERRITFEECVNALDTFENGKTPGNDGIPSEFYKVFWSSDGELMTEVFKRL